MFRPTERKKVQWSPHNANQFVVGGNDLRLYEIRSSVRIGHRQTQTRVLVTFLIPLLTSPYFASSTQETSKAPLNESSKHFEVLPPTGTNSQFDSHFFGMMRQPLTPLSTSLISISRCKAPRKEGHHSHWRAYGDPIAQSTYLLMKDILHPFSHHTSSY